MILLNGAIQIIESPKKNKKLSNGEQIIDEKSLVSNSEENKESESI
jgi:hypothetical protein